MKHYFKNPAFLIITTALVVSAVAYSPVIFFGNKAKFLSSITGGLYFSGNRKLLEDSGPKNYISNGHFEVGVDGWTAYDDGATSTPVDASGGSPGVTCTQSVTSIAHGVGSLKITKDAADRQGEGCSYPFTVPATIGVSRDVFISFTLKSNISSYASNDVGVYIIPAGGGTPLTAKSLPRISAGSTLNPITEKVDFLVANSCTDCVLAFHIKTTNAGAYDVYIDDIKIQQMPSRLGGTKIHASKAAQSVTGGSQVKLALNTETFDTNGEFDNATNYRFRPTRAGYFLIAARTTAVGIAAGNRVDVEVQLTGALGGGCGDIGYTEDAGNPYTACTCMAWFDGVDDYAEVWVKHSDGANARDMYGDIWVVEVL